MFRKIDNRNGTLKLSQKGCKIMSTAQIYLDTAKFLFYLFVFTGIGYVLCVCLRWLSDDPKK